MIGYVVEPSIQMKKVKHREVNHLYPFSSGSRRQDWSQAVSSGASILNHFNVLPLVDNGEFMPKPKCHMLSVLLYVMILHNIKRKGRGQEHSFWTQTVSVSTQILPLTICVALWQNA
jgi:hypothetical protein